MATGESIYETPHIEYIPSSEHQTYGDMIEVDSLVWLETSHTAVIDSNYTLKVGDEFCVTRDNRQYEVEVLEVFAEDYDGYPDDAIVEVKSIDGIEIPDCTVIEC